MPSKDNDPVMPYTRDIPYRRMAADRTPMMKNFRAASLERSSALRQPASRKAGPETSSNPTNSVTRSRLEAITIPPSSEAMTRK